jgi:hypothetical protein
MKLFWKDSQGENGKEYFLLVEPAAKLASVELRSSCYYFKCLNQYVPLKVESLEQAKRLAEVRLMTLLRELLETLNLGPVPNEAIPDVRSAG